MALIDGYTLMHEHMSLNLSPADMGTESFDLLCMDLKEAYRLRNKAIGYRFGTDKEGGMTE